MNDLTSYGLLLYGILLEYALAFGRLTVRLCPHFVFGGKGCDHGLSVPFSNEIVNTNTVFCATTIRHSDMQ